MVSAGEGPPPVSLLPEASWAPLACVLVYCVRLTGEIVTDLIWLPVTPTFTNKVSISALISGQIEGALLLDSPL